MMLMKKISINNVVNFLLINAFGLPIIQLFHDKWAVNIRHFKVTSNRFLVLCHRSDEFAFVLIARKAEHNNLSCNHIYSPWSYQDHLSRGGGGWRGACRVIHIITNLHVKQQLVLLATITNRLYNCHSFLKAGADERMHICQASTIARGTMTSSTWGSRLIFVFKHVFEILAMMYSIALRRFFFSYMMLLLALSLFLCYRRCL